MIQPCFAGLEALSSALIVRIVLNGYVGLPAVPFLGLNGLFLNENDSFCCAGRVDIDPSIDPSIGVLILDN